MKKARNSEVTIIIPAMNEERGIGLTLGELRQVLNDPYYIVVDGNSVDETAEIARRMGARVIAQEGRGKGKAIAQALEYVNSDTRYVVFIDADFTYPAEYIPKMIETLEANMDVGMVTGNRFNERFILKNMNNAYYLGNRFLALMQHVLNGVKLRDPLTGLRVVRWDVLKDWEPKSKGFDVETELNYYIEKNGHRIVEIPIHYRKRLGEKKLKLRHGFAILKRMLLSSLQSLW